MLCVFFVIKCSTSRIITQVLGLLVLGQHKGMHPCIVINKNDDDRHSAFKNAPKNNWQNTDEGKKWKQQVMDKLLKSPTK